MNNGPDSFQPQSLDSSLQTDASNSISLDQQVSQQGVVGARRMPQSEDLKAARHFPWRRILVIALFVFGLGAAAFVVTTFGKHKNQQSNLGTPSAQIKSQTVGLTALSQQLASVQPAGTLTINGQVVVGSSLVLQPSSQPTHPVTGQMYFDQNANNIAFYNGSQFQYFVGSTTNITNINNLISNTSNVTNINGAGGGVGGTGTPGTIAMFTVDNQLGDSLIKQTGSTVAINGNAADGNSVSIDSGSAGTIQIGNSASNHTIQIGSGAGLQSTTVGSTFDGSTTTVQGGTGNVNVQTGATTGSSGSINIKTGDSSTTAAGNITIDTGHSIINGQIIEDKTFESGFENMNSWFGNSIVRSTAQAHTGNYSLAEIGNAANWGIIETLPGVSVTAGHQYYFSIWVRADTTPRSIIAQAVFNGTTTILPLTPAVDSPTGWTEVTGLAVAPGGATSVYFRVQGLGVAGEIHYFDDMTVTDLSSSSAAAVINIGNTNAKIVTIGNINQIGATTINGGSGIKLNSGAADTTINGGVINITGTAASAINTTAGALTLGSADTASWGINTATTGIGGDLTIHGGRGGTDAVNNGGNLFLQGGAANGAGLPGSVIVKPPADSADIFQIQNSSGTKLLTTDTSTMTLTISGTTSQFATLVLADTHLRSAQTTPPTAATPTNCGTTPTAAMTAGSTDNAGSFTITTGTGGTSSTCDTVLTFNKPFGAAPKSILVVGQTDTASVSRQVYVSASSPTTFTISFATSTGGADSTAYHFSYWVIE